MNTHELPMVIFTVLTQMSVGTFLALGVIELLTRRRHDQETRDRLVDPALYAIGPTLVVGLAVSMLHMNDPTNMLNVIRHGDSSWLSREIWMGVLFAAVGFLYAFLEWFKKGSHSLHQVIAGAAALLGLGLVWAQSMVYYSLVTVPAWHSWVVPFQFFATTVLLGALAVGAALMVTTLVRTRATAAAPGPADPDPTASRGGLALQVRTRVHEINAPTSEEEWQLTAGILKGVAVVGTITCLAILAVYPLYLVNLGQGDAAAQASAAVFSGAAFWTRLVLTASTAVLLGFFVYRMALSMSLTRSRTLVTLVLVCLVLALVAELLGRMLHYEAMVRVGM
ncbi:MAG TPA: dimethyl sulfoxide reductase anchor subunit [Nocardioides sp.]|uniref:dimethyl sulfoxide reductase anchor subunit family protein n=1 Tax=Nocardioides sp. TaxID=35761 RepID=UPI002BD30878|nr:DmsC/YnfH family molybdoenzyme membrane anchor subunit [Nocardioides sp.]HQR26920.1 dimethyl sulfoxide reductase anchor subunit [Nocardioides sp.]